MTLNLSKLPASNNNTKDDSCESIEVDLDEISLKTVDQYSPWFSIYRDTFFSYYRPLDYETFDHPVAWLMITSTSNPDPVAALTQLLEKSNKLNLGAFVDPDTLKYFILIFDPKKDNMNDVQVIFEKMKKTFGLHCDLLALPSRASTSSPIGHISSTSDKPNIWSPYRDTNQKPLLTPIHQLDPSGIRSGSRSGFPGQHFGPSELNSIGDLVKKMTLESIIPFLERKMHHMNEQVASSRRGFTGRLLNVSRRYFNTSRPNSPSPTGSTPNNYTYNSPEGQMRKLGDLAFMLRDFNLAQSTYESVKKDFQSDKSWNFYSAAQMMIGVCLLLSDDSELGQKLDVERYFDKSLSHFTTSKLWVSATRTCFIYFQLFTYLERFNDIPTLLNYLISEESDLRSGLCLEQIAYAYLSMNRPHQRKYAYYLTLAGSRYNRCNQREHAYNCYLKSHRAFQIGQPIELDDGGNNNNNGEVVRVKKSNPSLYKTLYLATKRIQQSPQTQAQYLKEFLYTYDNYVKSTSHELLLEPQYYLPIPQIDPLKINIELENSFDPKFHTKDQSHIWEDLETQVFGKDTKLDLKTGLIKNTKLCEVEGGNWCLVNEPLLIKLIISNPLQLSLNLSKLKLDCNYEGEKNESEVEGEESGEAFDLSKIDDFILSGGKKVELVYKLTPKLSGKILIKGLFFTLNESASSYKSFNSEQNSKHNKDNLVINAIEEMPQIQVDFPSPPEQILSGEVVSTLVELKNTGSKTCTKIWVKLSHSTFFSFTSSEVDLESHPLTSVMEVDNKVPDPSLVELDLTKFTPQGLEPGSTISLPLHIRGDRIGNHQFYLLFYCKSEQKQLYRTSRSILPLTVQPSLKINAFTRPSTLGLDQFILGVEVENVHNELEFNICQLSTSSLSWTVKPINIKQNINKEDTTQLKKLELNNNKGNLIHYFTIKKDKSNINGNGEINWDSPEAHLAKSLQDLVLDAKKFNPINPIQLTYTDIPLHGRDTSLSQNPTNSLYLASRSQFYKSSLSAHSKFISNTQRDSIFPLFMSNDIDMSLHWEVKNTGTDTKTQRRGHHFIIGINFSIPQNPLLDIVPIKSNSNLANSKSIPQQQKAIRALFESTAIEKSNLIQHLLNYQKFKNELNIKILSTCSDKIKQNFRKYPICKVPVKFLVTNTSWNRFNKVNLLLINNANSSGESSSNNRQSLQVGGLIEEFDPNNEYSSNGAGIIELYKEKNPQTLHFQWNGQTSLEFTLNPQETRELECTAIITYPGIYNLNSWQLRAQVTEMGEALEDQVIYQVLKQFAQNQSLISLDNSYLHSPTSALLCQVVNDDEYEC
ncbi:hypothetical protein CONCODRAFT_19144 [Conidiobolus coronatus NRRL 28638]|uniref:Trafficking protein particle complex subunit 8 n=1 Tax=Conidiobolus coronatus (strain ATCC 28846 / CBS 209.66 / NRRL 28638) TaxID=796925 RepID=A0A137NZK8_CONC2|nr:hypothetical protein CONCODRAFT_19144 [Conidiobolus coronatus NRRL 28638]|eukprot:KXN68172.1 hypothetical protein CONCODRAFT_19144 [Conidiobolus coronatus NRRL 28638]